MNLMCILNFGLGKDLHNILENLAQVKICTT